MVTERFTAKVASEPRSEPRGSLASEPRPKAPGSQCDWRRAQGPGRGGGDARGGTDHVESAGPLSASAFVLSLSFC